MILRVDNGYDVAVFSSYVCSRTIRRESRLARASTHEERLNNLTVLCVDHGDRAARFGGDVYPTPVRTHRRALGFESDGHRRNHTICFDVGNRSRAGVFVGDVESRGAIVDREVLRIGAGVILRDDVAVYVKLGNCVLTVRLVSRITDRNPDAISAWTQTNASQPPADSDRRGDPIVLRVDHSDRAVAFVGDKR